MRVKPSDEKHDSIRTNILKMKSSQKQNYAQKWKVFEEDFLTFNTIFDGMDKACDSAFRKLALKWGCTIMSHVTVTIRLLPQIKGLFTSSTVFVLPTKKRVFSHRSVAPAMDVSCCVPK